jgi:hypothetical protein
LFCFLPGELHFGNLIGCKPELVCFPVSEAQQHGGRIILFRFAQAPDSGNGFLQQLSHSALRQLISPACTMASRTAAFDLSDKATIGSRTASSHLPKSDRAYLAGDGLVSTKRF